MKLNKILITSALLALGACSSSDNNNDTGTLSLNITDAPIGDVTKVVVQFSGITLKAAEGEDVVFMFEDDPDTTDIDESLKTIDLLTLQGSSSAPLLEGVEVPEGEYNQIRLHVNANFDGENDSYVVLNDGGTVELRVPSGSQSGLKVNTSLVISTTDDAADSSYTIDFDLAKSVINPKGQDGYLLKPTLRMVQDSLTGSIAGTVDIALLDGCSGEGNAVYAFEGADAIVDDNGSANEPMATALVKLNDNSGDYEYELGYLNGGDYTLAFTCEADLDFADDDEDDTDNNPDDDIVFTAGINVAVVAGEETEQNF